MKYQSPSTQAEESVRQRLIAELQIKIEKQADEIQHWKKENEKLRQEKDDLNHDMQIISESTISLQREITQRKAETKAWKDRYNRSRQGKGFSMRWSFLLTGLLLYSLWMTAYFIPTTQTFQAIRAFMKSMTLTDYVLAGVGLLLGVLLLYYFMGKLHKIFYGY
mgnify:CR=1 FL=1